MSANGLLESRAFFVPKLHQAEFVEHLRLGGTMSGKTCPGGELAQPLDG
jgi:hypothetical protein